MRRAARVDRNHAEIVDALRKCGARVLDLSRVGRGCPDLLVHVGRLLVLVEVKTPQGTWTEAQERFREAGWPVITITDVQRVPQVIATLQKRSARS